MSKDGLDVSISTLVLMIVTITYKAVLVLVGFVVLIFMGVPRDSYLYGSFPLPILYLGMGLNVITVTSMMILVFVPGWTKRILYYGLRFLEKMHLLKHKGARTKASAFDEQIPGSQRLFQYA